MRNATKTITFEFEFQYPTQGKFQFASSITVCEPGYDNRDVYRRMKGYMAEAVRGMQAFASGKSKDEIATAVESEGVSADADVDSGILMNMALQGDAYAAYCAFVQRAITGNRGLAFVGDDETGRAPITEQVWLEISKQGGMDAVDRVIHAFGDLFLQAPPSQPPTTKTGTGTSSPSDSTAKASSRTAKRA